MKVAIILFNLGGPDSLDAVEPFLRNLFGDPAILRLPSLIRRPLANFLARRRAPKARAIYAKIGGSSPIVGQTEAQARALEQALGSDHDWRGYVCMRYWHPMTEAVVQSVKRFAPDRIVLLPLYPQYSTTTTASSVRAWTEAARFKAPARTIDAYPTEEGFIAASVDLVKQGLAQVGDKPKRVLFSAHGLPERVIKAGDP
ncbi:MAG TPA: ferrochelatase, partial [Reyranella sp.]|nr:ferrochelatase [Reyranella sp.]